MAAMLITCPYCALDNATEHIECQRCGALLPTERDVLVDEEQDRATCPSCQAINTTSAEYCTSCGTPMAVITRVIELVNHNERGPLETWRVYGVETKMVARKAQLKTLRAWHDTTQTQQRTMFTSLCASTGLGKSRLIAEFHRELDSTFTEALLLPVECQEVTSGAFQMFAKLFKTRFYIADNEPVAIAKRKLQEAIKALLGKEHDPTHTEELTSLISHMMGFPSDTDEPGHEPQDQSTLDRLCFDAVTQLLRADSAQAPMIIVLEDLQYASTQSLRLLQHLRKNLSSEPILFILSWNPDELYADTILESFSYDDTMVLGPLDDDQVDAFVRHTLHKVEDLPDTLVEKIVESAHGNPLAVEETLRLLIGEGVIDTRQEPWTITRDKIKKLKLPQTVEAAVRARIEALGEDERELLRMASCIGDNFWPPLLVSLWRLQLDSRSEASPEKWKDSSDLNRIEAILEGLERKDIIRRRNDSMLPQFQELHFKHRLERKTIYQGQLKHIKQRYHRLIAQWLDRQIPADDRGVLSEFIAQHFDNARALEQAATHYLKAAQWSRSRYANRKAIELYTKALSYMSDTDMAMKIQAFHDLGSVHDLMGEFDQSLAYYRELLRYAWLLNDKSKAGVALNKIGRAYRNLSDFDEALSCLKNALEHFKEAEDLAGIASTLDDMGKVHWIKANYDEALTHYRSGLSIRRELENQRSIALSLNHIGSLHLQRGELRDAMIYFKEALKLRREVNDRQGLAESFNNLGILCMERSDYQQASTLFHEALEISREIGYKALEGILLNNLGETHLHLNHEEEAQALLEDAMDVAEESGEKRLLFDILRNLGQAHLNAMERNLALDYLEQAIEVAEDLDAKTLIATGMQSIADLHARYVFDPDLKDESTQLAQSKYKEASTLFANLGNESQLGRCLSSYGQFLVETGDFIQGKQKLQQAQEIFKRLEMQKLWEATERVITNLG